MLIYADDIVLISPSAKGLQRLLDVTCAYCDKRDIAFNRTKSQLMVFDTMRTGFEVSVCFGTNVLMITKAYKCLCHIVRDDVSDEDKYQV